MQKAGKKRNAVLDRSPDDKSETELIDSWMDNKINWMELWKYAYNDVGETVRARTDLY